MSGRTQDTTASRRTVLGAIAATAVLAGCLGRGDDSADENREENGNDDANGDDAGTDENGEENGDDDGNGGDDDENGEESFDPEALENEAETFIEQLADGEFETAATAVDPVVADQLSAPVLENAWDETAGQLGALEAVVQSEFEGVEDELAQVTVTAQFAEGTQLFEFAYSHSGVAGFFITESEWEAPPYVDEATFTEEELEFEATDACSLGGTLTVPKGATENPVPGVVIVHGNGPIDRDSTIGPNRTYKELAWGLATEGIAVLRYDKRTYACDIDLADVTIDDVATADAVTALTQLHEDDRISDVFVAGHSFGGLLAPRIAQWDGNLAGIVMLAPGPARPIADTIVAQNDHLLSLDDSLTDAEREAALAEVKAMAEQIRTLDIEDDEVVHLGGREYYESLQGYDHVEAVASREEPIYLAVGGRDWQVTVEDDLPIWEDAVAGRENATITVYDDLNHHFQTSDGEMTATEYRDPDAFVAETLIADVAAFLSS